MKCLNCDNEALPNKALCALCLKRAEAIHEGREELRSSEDEDLRFDTTVSRGRALSQFISYFLPPGRLLYIACTLLILGLLLSFFGVRIIPYFDSAGIKVSEQPKQTDITNGIPWMIDGIKYVPRAYYDIRARVLAHRPYFFGVDADIRKYDFCVGWGQMSDSTTLQHFSFRQEGRSCKFLLDSESRYLVQNEELMYQFANMHLIPANFWIRIKLGLFGRDSIVHLKGKLVDVQAPNWYVNTSLTRSDSSCETMWVEEVGWD